MAGLGAAVELRTACAHAAASKRGYEHTITLWFNTSAFVPNASVAPDNARRGAVIGPGFWRQDLSLIHKDPSPFGSGFQKKALGGARSCILSAS